VRLGPADHIDASGDFLASNATNRKDRRYPPLKYNLLVGWRGGPERVAHPEKGEFTEPEHAVFGTAVEIRYVHQIVSGFGHESDDFRD
jgi:hypothetical protein